MTRPWPHAAWDLLCTCEKDEAVLRRVVEEIWNEGDIDLADELFSSTYVNHGGLIPDLVQGPEGIRFSVALYRTAFPGLHIRVDDLSSSDGTVHMHWTAQRSVAEPGKDTAGALNFEQGFSGSMKSSVSGGQIVESWTSWDSTEALRALEVFHANHEESS